MSVSGAAFQIFNTPILEDTEILYESFISSKNKSEGKYTKRIERIELVNSQQSNKFWLELELFSEILVLGDKTFGEWICDKSKGRIKITSSLVFPFPIYSGNSNIYHSRLRIDISKYSSKDAERDILKSLGNEIISNINLDLSSYNISKEKVTRGIPFEVIIKHDSIILDYPYIETERDYDRHSFIVSVDFVYYIYHPFIKSLK